MIKLTKEQELIAILAQHAAQKLPKISMPAEVANFCKQYPYYSAYFTAVGMFHAADRHPHWGNIDNAIDHIWQYDYNESVLTACPLQHMHGTDVYYRAPFCSILNYLQSLGMTIEWSYLDGKDEGEYVETYRKQKNKEYKSFKLYDEHILEEIDTVQSYYFDAVRIKNDIEGTIALLHQVGMRDRYIPAVLFEQVKMMGEIEKFYQPYDRQ